MALKYLETYTRPQVEAVQKHYYGRSASFQGASPRDPMTDLETSFIQERDSFYMATVNEDGWPYLQHRGGEPGFMKVVDAATLAFADFKGNRQLLSIGHLNHHDRIAIFFMDYPQRRRLKLIGHAHVEDVRGKGGRPRGVLPLEGLKNVERIVWIDVVSFDWNCPKFITPRYSAREVEEVTQPLRRRIAELESKLGDLT